MHAVAGGVDPDNFRNIFNVAINEASRVSFPNQTFCRLKSI